MEISCFGDSTYVKLPGWGTRRVVHPGAASVKDACHIHGVEDFFVLCGGKVVDPEETLVTGVSYIVCRRLRGGKGGFGSMLRAIGAQIEKTTNREACRDLSGRRMRDVNNEKKMMEYLEKKAEREREREKKKKEKLERLTQAPKHFFNDPEYESKLHDVVENVDKALEKGLKSHSKKRKPEPKNGEHEGPEVKKGLWLGFNEASDSDSDSDDDDMVAHTATQQSGDSSGSKAGPSCSKDTCNEETISNITKGETASVSESASMSHTDESGEMVCESDQSPEVATDPADNGVAGENEGAVSGDVCNMKDASIDRIVKTENATTACPDGESQTIQAMDGTDIRMDESAEIAERVETAQKHDTDNLNKHDNTGSTITTPSASSSAGSERAQDMDTKPTSTDQTTEACVRKDENASESVAETGKASGDAEKKQPTEIPDVDLSDCTTIEDLENLGLDILKVALIKRGVKCGGTLKERAVRLYNVKDLSPDKINPNLLAKSTKKRSRSKK